LIWEKAFRLNMQPIVDEEQLQQIANLLGNGVVSRITFKSPGTNITYAPLDYIAVGQLIVNRRKRRVAIVHEATHVIQDWEDVSSLAHQDEADAFIAESVAELSLYPDSRDPNDGESLTWCTSCALEPCG
jgi:hypothetical protein